MKPTMIVAAILALYLAARKAAVTAGERTLMGGGR